MIAFTPMSDDQLRRSWLTYFVLGIVLVVLGTIGLSYTIFFTIVSVEFYGFLLIGGGILQAAHGFWRRHWGGFFLDLLTGLLYLAVGFMFVANPLESAAVLTLLIALALIFGGLFRIFAGISGRFPHWLWLLAHGLISVALGILIWRSWPESSFWAIGLFVAIDLILNGWTLVMLGLGLRSVVKVSGPGQ